LPHGQHSPFVEFTSGDLDMSTYRFIGASACVGSRELTQFGQKVLLTAEQATAAVCGGAAILPETVFLALGFTDEELRRYAFAGSHPRATSAFLGKKDAALTEFRALQRSLVCS
jgi:hypothetical protein